MGYCVQLPGSLLPVKSLSLSLSVLFFYKQRTEHSCFLTISDVHDSYGLFVKIPGLIQVSGSFCNLI